MAAQYPTALVTTTQLPDNRADGTAAPTNHAQDHNNLADEIIAIEAELGTLPKGQFSTAKSRLNNAEYGILSMLGKAAAADTVLAQTTDLDIIEASGASAAATNTRLTLGAIWLPKGCVVKGHRNMNRSAGGTASVASSVCLLTTDGTTLTVQAGKFSAIGASNTGLQQNTYASSFTTTYDGIHYLGYYISSANAMPTLAQMLATDGTGGLDPEATAGYPRVATLLAPSPVPAVGQAYLLSLFTLTSTNFPWQAAFGTPA